MDDECKFSNRVESSQTFYVSLLQQCTVTAEALIENVRQFGIWCRRWLGAADGQGCDAQEGRMLLRQVKRIIITSHSLAWMHRCIISCLYRCITCLLWSLLKVVIYHSCWVDEAVSTDLLTSDIYMYTYRGHRFDAYHSNVQPDRIRSRYQHSR